MKTLLLLTSLFAVSIIHAQPGTLDPSFGTDGLVITRIENTYGSSAHCMVIQTDGKILVAGDAAYDNEGPIAIAVARYNDNGTLDSSFGTGGIDTITLSGLNDMAVSIGIQSDGKIVIAAQTGDLDSNALDFGLVRLNTDGSPDNTFGTNGKVQTFLYSTGNDYAITHPYTMAIQQDGKIIVAGFTNILSYADLVRYNTNGTLDPTFGVGGRDSIHINAPPNESPPSADIAIQADGKILMTVLNSLFRLNSNGVLDTAFGGAGIIYPNISFYDQLSTIAIQPDEKIIIGGRTADTAADYFALARYDAMGNPDPTFGTGGKATLGEHNSTFGNSMALQPDGKIVMTGSEFTGPHYSFAFVVGRFTADGTADSIFGTDGFVTTSFPLPDTCPACVVTNFANAIGIQADGKILAAGSTYLLDTITFLGYSQCSALARYLVSLNAGVIDINKPVFNSLIYPNPLQKSATLEYELTADAPVTLQLFDLEGKLVKTFFASEKQAAGKQKVTLGFNQCISAGAYILQLRTNDNTTEIRMLKD